MEIMLSGNIVIVGAGHAAGQVVASLRQKNHSGKVTLLGDEAHYPYQRPPLSKKFLAGEMPAARLYFKPPEFYDHPNVTVHQNTTATRIDLNKRLVTDDSGNDYKYEKLVMATGASVRKLSIPGATLAGVHYLRKITDVEAMQAQMRAGAKLTIVGAGYIGLEVAAVAQKLGLQVTVVEMADRVMSRVVSPAVSAFYESEHRKQGVNLMLSTGIASFSGDTSVQAVELENGDSVISDMVLIGIGVIPNIALAESAGLIVDNGIQVNERCLTSDDNVYAIGDCTNHPNELLGRRLRLESVHNALEQAKTAAANICGEQLNYAQVPWFWSDQYDLKLQIAGISSGYDNAVLRGDPARRSFSCVYTKSGRIVAVDAINAPKDFMQSKSLIGRGALLDMGLLADVEIPLKELAD